MIEPLYQAAADRYDSGMAYARCGKSGILLPRISLGLWHNFGEVDPLARSKEILHYAFDHGICAFDLANNYGPGYGTAEETFGYVFEKSLRPYRDELFISSKAGYDMWPGPYGNWGSRKYLMASLHQSLRRMHLDYVDVFYSHRYDPATPLTETLQALVDIVRQGKALYVGLSRWPLEAAAFGLRYLREHDTPCLLFQDRHNIIDRHTTALHDVQLHADDQPCTFLPDGSLTPASVLDAVAAAGAGFIVFSPLAGGLLTGRYLHGIPAGSRAAKGEHLQAAQITPELVAHIAALNALAERRGQTLAQMALAWVLHDKRVTSVIAGCSSVAQLQDSMQALSAPEFDQATLDEIDRLGGLMRQCLL